MSKRLLGSMLVVLAASAWDAAAEVRLERRGPSMQAEHAAAKREVLSSDGGRHRLAWKGVAEDSRQFLLPFYLVDKSDAFGRTTLFAVRNADAPTVQIVVSYLDLNANPVKTSSHQVAANAVRTVNIRDVGGLPIDAQGISRGMVLVTGPQGSNLTADFFRVDAGQGFATGDRMVDASGLFLCDFWDVRYLQGGAFTGGTVFTLLLNNAPGTFPESPRAATIAFFDEAGNFLDAIDLFTSVNLIELPMADLMETVPGLPPFGALEIVFYEDAQGGFVSTVYSATDQFSVGMTGTCLAP